jgi:hypothetical protein
MVYFNLGDNKKQAAVTIFKHDNNEINIGHTNLNSSKYLSPNFELMDTTTTKSHSTINILKTPASTCRFNLNFVKVSPYYYTENGGNYLSLIRRGYEPHYQNPNKQQSFTGKLVFGLLETFIRNKR